MILLCLYANMSVWITCRLVRLGQLGHGVLQRRQLGLHDAQALCEPHFLALQELLHLTENPHHLVLIHTALLKK